MSTKTIFLWCAPRTLSNAFQKAIFQLDGIKHFCEPFQIPHLVGSNKRSIQYVNEPEVEEHIMKMAGKIPTHTEVLKEIEAEHNGCNVVFIKEMAMYVWPDKIPNEIMESSCHTFLIRHPEKAIKSVYRQTLNFEESLWSHLVVDELGFKEQCLMFEYIRNDLNMDVMVIDADDLMRNPKYVLREYCTFVGLEFDNCMLDWKKDEEHANTRWTQNWNAWTSWIKDVNETCGFRKEDKVQDMDIDYPQFLYDAISNNMTYYEKLREHKLILKGII